MTDKKTPIDWTSIERDYIAGAMSNRDLAAWYKISEGAIRKRAKRLGWVKESTQGKLRTEKPAPITITPTPVTPETTSPEAIVGRGRNLTLRLLDELEATTTNLGELEQIIDTLIDTGTDEGKKAREAINQALTLKSRSEVLKSLATAAKTLGETITASAGGKKAERQRGAEEIAKPGGKFSPPAPPKLVVDNNR